MDIMQFARRVSRRHGIQSAIPVTGRQAGFTLVEILVALAIVSVALAAASRAVAALTENHRQLQDRVLAQLSAENLLAEFRLGGTNARPGVQKSDCSQGKLVLECLVRITNLPGGMREVSIDVVHKERPVPAVLSMTRVLGAPNTGTSLR